MIRAICVLILLSLLCGCAPAPTPEPSARQRPASQAAARPAQPGEKGGEKPSAIKWESVSADDPEWNAAQAEATDDADQPAEGAGSDIVYVTKTGDKYHAAGCRSLAKSSTAISRADAIAQGYTPCSICNP